MKEALLHFWIRLIFSRLVDRVACQGSCQEQECNLSRTAKVFGVCPATMTCVGPTFSHHNVGTQVI